MLHLFLHSVLLVYVLVYSLHSSNRTAFHHKKSLHRILPERLLFFVALLAFPFWWLAAASAGSSDIL